jgi:hypothetical protein
MCDYSLTNIRSRPARVGDKLTVRHFGTGTRGFAAAGAAEDNRRGRAPTTSRLRRLIAATGAREGRRKSRAGPLCALGLPPAGTRQDGDE